MSHMSPERILILEMLRDNPSGLFGLDIVTMSDGKIGRGMVHVYLGPLEEEELVTCERVPQSIGLPRPLYKLTKKGRRVLDEGFDALGAHS